MALTLWALFCPAPVHAQDGGPPAPQGPGLHLGAVLANTPSGRSLAADVVDLAVKAARARGLHVTSDPPEAWDGPDMARHEGALRKCLNPWLQKSAVLACLDGLTYPRLPPPPPATTSYLVEGTVTSSEAGLVVQLTLYPILDGQPGPAMVVRSSTVTGRLRRPAREKALQAMMDPLWDAALGVPPRKGGRGP